MTAEEAPDQPARCKWEKHILGYDSMLSFPVDHGS